MTKSQKFRIESLLAEHAIEHWGWKVDAYKDMIIDLDGRYSLEALRLALIEIDLVLKERHVNPNPNLRASRYEFKD